MPNQADPAFAEFISRCHWPVVLIEADGRVAAASQAAAGIAARAGVGVESFEEAARVAGLRVTVTSLSDGRSTVAAEPAEAGAEAGLLEAIIEACQVSLIVLDLDGRVLRWNPAAERMYGYSYAEVAGRVLPVIPESEQGQFAENMRSLLGGQSVRDTTLRRRHKDGSLKELRLSAAPVKDAGGRTACVVAVYEDLTELNETVRNLERSQAQLQHAQRLASMGNWTLDLTDETLTWSPEVHRIHGTDPATFQPTRPEFRKLVHPDDLPALNAAVERAQRTGEPYAVDYRVVRPDGEIRHCRVSAEPMKDASGKVVGLLFIGNDISVFHAMLQKQVTQTKFFEHGGNFANLSIHSCGNGDADSTTIGY